MENRNQIKKMKEIKWMNCKVLECEYKLAAYIGPYALIYCLVKGNKMGYFVTGVSQKPPTFYELKHKDFENLVGVALCWEHEKDQYDEEVDIPFTVLSDIISKWEKAI